MIHLADFVPIHRVLEVLLDIIRLKDLVHTVFRSVVDPLQGHLLQSKLLLNAEICRRPRLMLHLCATLLQQLRSLVT